MVLLLATAPDAPAPGLPEALPPLNERLLTELMSAAPEPGQRAPLRMFGQGRLRAELDESRDLSALPDTAFGATLTGRIGIEASTNTVRATLVVGDGGRLGPSARLPTLVPRPFAAVLLQAELAVDVDLVGMRAACALGRAPLVIADGRFIGAEAWDARGRFVDGARVIVHGDSVEATFAAVSLDSAQSDALPTLPSASALGSGLLVASFHATPVEGVVLDSYAWLHRDASTVAQAVTVPNLGARLTTQLGRVQLAAGGDVQGTVRDVRTDTFIAGTAAHGEATARVTAPLSMLVDAPDPFAALHVEFTRGTVVQGQSFRAPLPTQHGALGELDFFRADNTASATLSLGGQTAGGLLMQANLLAIGAADANAAIKDIDGRAWRNQTPNPVAVFVEANARFRVPLTRTISLGGVYAVGVPGQLLVGDAPAQRLLVTLSFCADSDGKISPLP